MKGNSKFIDDQFDYQNSKEKNGIFFRQPRDKVARFKNNVITFWKATLI